MAEKRKDNKGRNLRTGESQRPDGRYMYRWQENGKTKSVYSMDLGDLREKERKIQRDLEDGINTSVADSMTLNEAYGRWIKTRTDLRKSTLATYDGVYKNCVRNSSIGNKKIAKIKYSDIIRFFQVLAEEKKYSIGYMAQINHVLMPLFEIAVRDDIIRKNPYIGTFGEICRKYYQGKPKKHSLTPREQNVFIDYIRDNPIYGHWLNLFTVFFGTGCRCGEVLGLRWEDCDFKNNTISINHSLSYRAYVGEKEAFHIDKPKTVAGIRTIPMLSDVRRALLRTKEEQMRQGVIQPVIDGYTNFVFTSRNGTPYVRANIQRVINKVLQYYNEEEKESAEKEGREPELIRHFSIHNIRHTFASRFCENETNLKAIQEIMGHADIQTTMNIYAEATAEAKKQSMENLEGKMKLS